MTEVERLANFVSSARYEDLAQDAVRNFQIRILDSLGCAMGALDADPVLKIRNQLHDFGGNPLSTLIGGGATSPDRAAFYNGALVRYLDFMDSYLAPGETFHPSDNLAPVLAASEYADSTGKEFLTALAVSYEVQTRLSEAAPVRAKGFDHTTQGAYAAAAGVTKALGLDARSIANAIAMSGTANNALRVTRTGALSQWKGLAYPNTAFSATHLAFLAMRGVTGPLGVFEGAKGFKQTIAGPFEIDWSNQSLEAVKRSIIKKFNAEIHAQSAIEGVLELQHRNEFPGAEIDRIDIEIFQVAYNIIGGGEEGDKTIVKSKEEADHSLQYMVAAALLDGQLYPEQYEEHRIFGSDVQSLLRRVTVRPNAQFSSRFPDEMPVRVGITLKDQRNFVCEKSDYEGFHTRPVTWDHALGKFRALCKNFVNPEIQALIVETISVLPDTKIRQLTKLLEKCRRPGL